MFGLRIAKPLYLRLQTVAIYKTAHSVDFDGKVQTKMKQPPRPLGSCRGCPAHASRVCVCVCSMHPPLWSLIRTLIGWRPLLGNHLFYYVFPQKWWNTWCVIVPSFKNDENGWFYDVIAQKPLWNVPKTMLGGLRIAKSVYLPLQLFALPKTKHFVDFDGKIQTKMKETAAAVAGLLARLARPHFVCVCVCFCVVSSLNLHENPIMSETSVREIFELPMNPFVGQGVGAVVNPRIKWYGPEWQQSGKWLLTGWRPAIRSGVISCLVQVRFSRQLFTIRRPQRG